MGRYFGVIERTKDYANAVIEHGEIRRDVTQKRGDPLFRMAFNQSVNQSATSVARIGSGGARSTMQ
ncbi:hypothetical protein PENCOP_c001G04637 [Penicillium coprophilum]|uniref:Uncharacterized protein n=1 Tax=Penicillium coprophilum TaxID=36646 RepID=A0A1V6V9P4_9EURO|nr:hypothetical protein PENCOP_c001G04637 [Penicillium coprophilum]